MKIKVKVHVNSSQEKVEELGEDSRCATFGGGNEKSHPSEFRGRSARKIKGFPRFEIWLKEKAVDGKANLELLKVLKKYFGKEVKIVKGFKSRRKVVEILD